MNLPSCGRMISQLGQWSPHWKGGSWRSAGWSGSAWWSRRSSSCRCRWPGRSCCQKAWSIKSEIYRFPRETFNRNIVFWGHKKVQKSMPISAEMYDALKNKCHLKQPIRFADLPAELFPFIYLFYSTHLCLFSTASSSSPSSSVASWMSKVAFFPGNKIKK